VDDLAAEGDGKPLLVHTPGQKTIEDVARFLGVSPKNKIKTLALMAEEKDAKTGKMKAAPDCGADARRSSAERSQAQRHGGGCDAAHGRSGDQGAVPSLRRDIWGRWGLSGPPKGREERCGATGVAGR
jgi:hypothetical protein